ncbi:hypothetical protein JZU61_00775, partial [bacterium]|nr:hypothetical protein [bacterium]
MNKGNSMKWQMVGVMVLGMMLAPECLLALPPGSSKVVLPVTEEALELGMKMGGKKVFTQAEREVLQGQLSAKALQNGDEAILAARKGITEVGKDGLSMGDDLLHYAQKSPQVAMALQKNPEVYKRLLQEHGDDILLIEEKAAGMAPVVAKTFSREELHWVASKVPAHDIPRLTAFAGKANDANTRKILLQSYGETAGKILDKLDAKKIMAIGLGASMFTTGYQSGDGLQQAMTATGNAIQHVSEKHPEMLNESVREVMMPATAPLSIVAFILAGGGVLYVFRRFPPTPKGKSESLMSRIWKRVTGKRAKVEL